MKRIGIFGGTFDPPHVGHLITATDLVESLSLTRMLLIPAGDPPHKPPTDAEAPSPAAVRLEMLLAAAAGDPLLEVDDRELRRPGPSYTVDTLRELREGTGGAELFLVIGVDQLLELATWREPEAIAGLARIVVVPRDGTEPPASAPGVQVPFEVARPTRVDVSSSEIRQRVREGRSIRYLVPEAVAGIIRAKRLYGNEILRSIARGRG